MDSLNLMKAFITVIPVSCIPHITNSPQRISNWVAKVFGIAASVSVQTNNGGIKS